MLRVRALSLTIAGTLCMGLLPAEGATADSPPTSGAFVASDFSWDAAGGGKTVTIAQGGTVSFSYPTGISVHNADFTSGAPSACAQTAGPSSGPVPPLPHQPTGFGWSGSCTFNQPGTYKFICDQHPFMTGTVAVLASGTSPSSSPLAGSASQSIQVARRQKGSSVHGSVKASAAGDGGTLQVTLLARRSDLGGKGSAQVKVGHITRQLHAGTVSFVTGLDQAGKRALKRHGRLGVQVKLVVRSPGGQMVSATRQVLLRR
jgi:plastocyanin